MPFKSKNSKNSDPKAITAWPSKISHGEELAKAMQKKIAQKNLTESKPTMSSKKTCICAPTSHEGSFKCNLHRSSPAQKSSMSVEDNGSGGQSSLYFFSKHKKMHGQPQLSRFGKAASAEPPHDGKQ